METDLAKQLRVLSGAAKFGVRRKDRASLLFTPEELDRLDKQTILEMARSGLISLGATDTSVATLRESPLFSAASLRSDRESITAKDDSKVNSMIKEALFVLSPYLLLPGARKALEHLIQRYKIHVYNGSEIIRAFLPFHQTPIFAKILSLIQWRDTDARLHFLHAAQKQG
ncbi:hypothetical protein AAMO2058_001098500, partial [Amorphochlora amoebiformis]